MHLKEQIKTNFIEILREKPILVFLGLTAWFSIIIGLVVDFWEFLNAL